MNDVNLPALADRLYLVGYTAALISVLSAKLSPSSTGEKIKNLCPTLSPFKDLENHEFQKLPTECQQLYTIHRAEINFENRWVYLTLLLGLYLLYRSSSQNTKQRVRTYLRLIYNNSIKSTIGGFLTYKAGANIIGAIQTSHKIHELCPNAITLSQIATASRFCQELSVVFYSSAFYGAFFGFFLTLFAIHVLNNSISNAYLRPQ